MKIDRARVLGALEDFARLGSGVVIGTPGVGKTHLLRQLNERLDADGTPHLFIPIEKLGTGTRAEIEAWLRTGLDGFFSDQVAQSPDVKGVIVFDSYDAARSEEAREAARRFIERSLDEVAGRWNVIVTVRTYDAARSRALLELFPDEDNAGVRSFTVPPLSLEELDQARTQIVGLSSLFQRSTPELQELLRVPFNLWLAEQVLSGVDDRIALESVRSEVQLLELYWQRRVSRTSDAADREMILHSVLSRMIARRALTVRRTEVYAPTMRSAWQGLLSADVLREESVVVGDPAIAFGHHILFDFAVSVLAIGDQPSEFIRFISEDPSRPLFLRPSLAYYLARSWYYRPTVFWRISLLTQQSESLPVRVFARLIPPLVVATEAASRDALQPLFQSFATAPEFAREFMLRLLQALRLQRPSLTAFWSTVAAEASQSLDSSFAWELVALATNLVETSAMDESEVKRQCALVGQRNLEWVLSRRATEPSAWIDALGANLAVPLVIKTMAADFAGAVGLLRRVLSIIEEPGFPIQYIYRLSDDVAEIAKVDPNLASDIYRVVFGTEEKSEAETNFGSPVMPLRSNRKQDFGMCQYVLVRAFPEFLKLAFSTAAVAGIDAVNSHVIRNRLERRPQAVESFEFRGVNARYLSDYSFIWGSGRSHESALELADRLFGHVGDLASGTQRARVIEFVDAMAERAIVAFLWRRLLQLAARYPEQIIPQIVDLLTADPIITGADTIHEAGVVLEKAGSAIGEAQWVRIQDRVVSLMGSEDARLLAIADRLLVSIPAERLTDERAKVKRRDLVAAGERNEPLSEMHISSRTYTHRDWLVESGVAVEREDNRKLVEVRETLERSTSAWQNNAPTANAARDLLRQADGAMRALADEPQADELVRQGVLTQVAALVTLAATKTEELSSSERDRLIAILLECSSSGAQADDSGDAFDFPAWSPTPRTESVRGIIYVVADTDDPSLLVRLTALAAQGSNPVRFLAASELFRVSTRHPGLFWQLVRERLQDERVRAIRDALFRTLYLLPASNSPLIAEIVQAQFERERTYASEGKNSDVFGVLLVWLALRRRESVVAEMLESTVQSAAIAPELLHSVVTAAVETITPEVIADSERSFIAEGAAALVLGALVRIRELFAQYAIAPASQAVATSLYQILDDVANRLYFNVNRDEEGESPTAKDVVAFYRLVKPILLELIRFGSRDNGGVIYAPTAHRLMEFCNLLLPLDPPGILHIATEVAVSSERTGYNVDSLAVREVVALVQALLADYRAEIQQSEALNDLIRLLDVFCRAGWPDALRLVLRLDEVFR